MFDIKKIAEKIAYYRKLNMFTQAELASLLGLSTAAVSKWEQGISCPDIMLLPDIAEILNVSIDELFGRNVIKEPVYDFIENVHWNDDGKFRIVLFEGKKCYAQSKYELKNGENSFGFAFDGAGYSIKGNCKIYKTE